MSLSDGFIDPEDLYESYKSDVTEQLWRTRRAGLLNAGRPIPTYIRSLLIPLNPGITKEQEG